MLTVPDVVQDISKIKLVAKGPVCSSYDWHSLLDGNARLLEHGVHFECSKRSFATLARKQRIPAGKRVSCRTTVDGKVLLQVVDVKPRKAKK